MYVHKHNLRYKIRVLILRFKLKVKLMLKKKKLHGNFVEMFLSTSDISFTDFVPEGVNGVLQLLCNLKNATT